MLIHGEHQFMSPNPTVLAQPDSVKDVTYVYTNKVVLLVWLMTAQVKKEVEHKKGIS